MAAAVVLLLRGEVEGESLLPQEQQVLAGGLVKKKVEFRVRKSYTEAVGVLIVPVC